VLRLLFRRLVAAAPTLLLVTLGVSLLLSIAPGDPALTIAGGAGEPSREQVEAVREKFHLDDSPFVQYGRWASGAVVLDFGTAYTGSGPVRDQIWSRLPITAGLAFAAVAIALLLAVPLGTVAGARSGGMLDRLSRMISTLGVSIPNFCLAILLVVVVAVDRRWLPSGGFVRLTDDPVEWLRHTLSHPAPRRNARVRAGRRPVTPVAGLSRRRARFEIRPGGVGARLHSAHRRR